MRLRDNFLAATSIAALLYPANSRAQAPTEGNSAAAIDGGATRVEDYLNSLPQFVAAQGASTLNTTDGTAQADLRGLGPERTLILINGRRLPYGSSLSGVPDLNQIPMALIERIDTVTGGASAVYGSDAIAGVVNFILMKDFEGIRIDGQVSAFQHGNDSADALGILGARGFAAPDRHVFDGESGDVNIIMGVNSPDGRGNVTAYAGYRSSDGIIQGERDFSACAYGGGAFSAVRPFGFACSSSVTSANGAFFTPFGSFTLDEAGPGNTFRPLITADGYNFAPTRSLLRDDERYVFGGFAHYEFSRHFDLYNETMYYDDATNAQFAHSGSFFNTTSINCDNPLMSAQQGALVCGPAFGLPISASLYPSKRFVEGAPLRDHMELRGLRLVGGVRGELLEGWNYDVSFQYADGENVRRRDNDYSISRIARALDVIDVGGTPTCRSAFLGTDPACVPLNIFRIGGVTPAALAYLQIPALQVGDTKQYFGQAIVSGNLGRLSPWNDDGIGVAAGFEWRKDSLSHQPDATFLSGDLAGLGGVTPPLAGSQKHRDVFFEVNIPLIKDVAFAERLAIEGGFRNSNPSTTGSYSTWKVGADWSLTPEFRLRGTWNRAARTPNVIELFSSQTAGVTFFVDPCAGPAPTATLAECVNTGIPPGLYASIPANPASQANAVFGGNPALMREKSDSWTVGAVLTVGDFLLTVDYFDISVEDFITEVSASTTLSQCLATGDTAICSRIHRDGAGTLWINGFVEATNGNLGRMSTSGLDVASMWRFEAGGAGALSFDFAASYVFDLKTLTLPNQPLLEFDCAGLYGGGCGSPKPEYRHKLTVTWETPTGLDASIGWRKISSVDLFGIALPDPTADRNHILGGRNYVDLAASYDVTRNLNITFGVNNLLDKNPPLTSLPSDLANGNTFPQTYDALGRYVYLGAQIDLFGPRS